MLALAGCSDMGINLPHIFGDEVPDEVKNEPRVVPTLPPEEEDQQKSWPLLGAVPSHPHDFTPAETIEAAKKQMGADRDDALQMQRNYQAAPPVTSSLAAPEAPTAQ